MRVSVKALFPILLTGFLLSLGSCKTQRVNSPRLNWESANDGNLQAAVSQDLSKTPMHTIFPITPPPTVPGESLPTYDLKTTVVTTEHDYKALKIEAVPAPDSDYLQFVICKKDTTSDCNPSFTEPLFFSAYSHILPSPIEGKLDVYVRSCVAKEHAVNYFNLCGPWEKKIHFQPTNFNADLKKFLINQYQEGLKVLEECYNIKEVLDNYRKSNPESRSQFDTLVDNYRKHIPPEICKEIFLHDEWQALEEAIKDESAVQSAGKYSGASVVLSLGAPALIGGLAVAGIGFFAQKYSPPVEEAKGAVSTSKVSKDPRPDLSKPKNKSLAQGLFDFPSWNRANLAKNLIKGGLIAATVGAVLVGVEVFGLDTTSIKAQNEMREQLNQIYEQIEVIRNEAKARPLGGH